jgi:hypothetical protein
MDLFSTLTFFPLVLQIALSPMGPEPDREGTGIVNKNYGVTAPY